MTSDLRILREAAESFYDVLQVFRSKRVPIAIQLFSTICAFYSAPLHTHIYTIWRETRALFFYLYGFYVLGISSFFFVKESFSSFFFSVPHVFWVFV